MTEEIKNPAQDFVGDLQVAEWVKKDRNGKEFISIKIDQYTNLFKVAKK